MAPWQSLRGWIARRRAELRLAVRMTAAGVLSLLIAHQLALAQSYWAVFTAILVVQASVGGSLKATADRLIGTLGGAAYGAVVACFLPHRGELALATAVLIALAPLALLSALRASFRIAPVTAIIVLLGGGAPATDPLVSAVDRVVEIALGSAVGMGVSLLLLPARAHVLVTLAGRGMLARMAALVPVLMEGSAQGVDGTVVRRHFDEMRGPMARLESCAEEARRERASRLTDEPDPEPLVRTVRRLRNDLAMLARAAGEPLAPPLAPRLGPALARAGAALAALLRDLGVALAERRAPPPLDPAEAALDAFAAEIEALRRDGVIRSLPETSVTQPFALGFALEQLRQDLRDLHARAGELGPAAPALR